MMGVKLSSYSLNGFMYSFNIVSSLFSWLTVGTLAGISLHLFTISSSTINLTVLETVTAALLAYNLLWLISNTVMLVYQYQNGRNKDAKVHFEFNAVGKAWILSQVLIGVLHYYTFLRVRSNFHSDGASNPFPDGVWTLWRPIGFLFIISFALQTVYISYFWRFQREILKIEVIGKWLDNFFF